MNNDWMWILVILGGLTCLLLSLLIRQQWLTIQKYQKEKMAQLAKEASQRTHIIQSIHILAQSMIERQVELSEGCIRIRVLLDYIQPTLIEQAPYTVFDTMFKGTEHMPTHEERKQTDKHFVNKMDVERYKLESENEDKIIEAAKTILKYEF